MSALTNNVVKCLLAMLSVTLASCYPLPKEVATSSTVAPIIRVSVTNLHAEFYQLLKHGMQERAAHYGYTIRFSDAGGAKVTQVADIDAFVKAGAAAIILVPFNSRDVVDAIERAHRAGIPVFTADIKSTSPYVVSHVSSDNQLGGKLAGKLLCKALSSGGGKAAIIGQPGITSVDDRVAGFRQEVEVTCPRVQIVANARGDGSRATALSRMSQLLREYDDLRGVFGINDETALGALAAIKKRHLAHSIAIVGYDASPKARHAIDSDKMYYGDVVQYPEQMGADTIDAVKQRLAGIPIPSEHRVTVGTYQVVRAACPDLNATLHSALRNDTPAALHSQLALTIIAPESTALSGLGDCPDAVSLLQRAVEATPTFSGPLVAVLRALPSSAERTRTLLHLLSGSKPDADRVDILEALSEEQRLPAYATASLQPILQNPANPTLVRQLAIDAASLIVPSHWAAADEQNSLYVLRSSLLSVLNSPPESKYYSLRVHAARALLHLGIGNVLPATLSSKVADLTLLMRKNRELALDIAEIFFAGGIYGDPGRFILNVLAQADGSESAAADENVEMLNVLIAGLAHANTLSQQDRGLRNAIDEVLQRDDFLWLLPRLNLAELVQNDYKLAFVLVVRYLNRDAKSSLITDIAPRFDTTSQPIKEADQNTTADEVAVLTSLRDMLQRLAGSNLTVDAREAVASQVAPALQNLNNSDVSIKTAEIGASDALNLLNRTSDRPDLLKEVIATGSTLGLLGSVLYFLVYLAILLSARWNKRALEMLGDNVFGRFAWPRFLLRFWRFAQVWVMEPAFTDYKKEASSARNEYFDVRVTSVQHNQEADVCLASALLGNLRKQRRLWLQGNAGMGKSKVAAVWFYDFIQSAGKSFWSTFKRNGFLLIVLRARDYATVTSDDTNWLIEAVRRKFGSVGLEVETWLIKAILKSGVLAIVVDGLNETDHDDDVIEFARSYPETAVIITSQFEASDTAYRSWRLPSDVHSYVDELLHLWLPKDSADNITTTLSRRGLLRYLKSGYDVRVLADLVNQVRSEAGPTLAEPLEDLWQREREQLPKDRLALYAAFVRSVRMADGTPISTGSLEALCWTMFVNNQYSVDVTQLQQHVAPSVVNALTKSRQNVSILRGTGPYEFRHVQLLAFLAARWLVSPPSAAVISDKIEQSAQVWQAGSQDDLWDFATNLLVDGSVVSDLWLYAVQDRKREALQSFLQRRAAALRVELVLSPPDIAA